MSQENVSKCESNLRKREEEAADVSQANVKLVSNILTSPLFLDIETGGFEKEY